MKEGDWTLLYGSIFKDFKGKLRTRWLGPNQIDTCYGNGLVEIGTTNETQVPHLVNGHKFKIYKNPMTKK